MSNRRRVTKPVSHPAQLTEVPPPDSEPAAFTDQWPETSTYLASLHFDVEELKTKLGKVGTMAAEAIKLLDENMKAVEARLDALEARREKRIHSKVAQREDNISDHLRKVGVAQDVNSIAHGIGEADDVELVRDRLYQMEKKKKVRVVGTIGRTKLYELAEVTDA